jgi:hypothetical protein
MLDHISASDGKSPILSRADELILSYEVKFSSTNPEQQDTLTYREALSHRSRNTKCGSSARI